MHICTYIPRKPIPFLLIHTLLHTYIYIYIIANPNEKNVPLLSFEKMYSKDLKNVETPNLYDRSAYIHIYVCMVWYGMYVCMYVMYVCKDVSCMCVCIYIHICICMYCID